MKNLRELRSEIEKANTAMNENYFSVEYSAKGFNHQGDYVHHCYVLKSESEIDQVGTPNDIIFKLTEMTNQMNTAF